MCIRDSTWIGPIGTVISTTSTIEVFEPGFYELIVTDFSTGCVDSDEVLVDLDSGFMLSIGLVDVSCFGQADGSIVVNIAGGTPPYIIEWEDSIVPMDLPPGLYTVSVSDASGCMSVAIAQISEPSPLSIEFTINANNQIEAIVTGGVGGYTYDWNVQADSSIIDNPINGTEYELTVTDANGCVLKDTYIFVMDGVFSPNAKEISVFPNPTDGLLHIQLDAQASQEVTELQIFDIQGIPMNLEQELIFQSKISLDLAPLQAGAYILQAVIDGDLYYQKVIVF